MESKLLAIAAIVYGFYHLWALRRDLTSREAEGQDGLGNPFKRSRDKYPESYWLTLVWYCIWGSFLIVGGIYALIAL